MVSNFKMSLVAQFDDLCRQTSILTESSEDDFLSFVINQEECRKRWLQTEAEMQRMNCIVNKIQSEKNALETKLKHCRNVISQELERRKKVEQERDQLQRQFNLIKEILLDSNAVNEQTREKLAFLNDTSVPYRKYESPKNLNTIDESAGSIISPSDIDLTEDDLDGISYYTRSSRRLGGDGKKRPSAPPLPNDLPQKKSKVNEINATLDATDSIVATTTVTVPPNGPIIASSTIETVGTGKKTRSFSEPVPTIQTAELPARLPFRSEGDEESTESLVWMETGLTPRVQFEPLNTLKKLTSVGRLCARSHDFVDKTVIRPEACISCDKRIKFGKLASKCKECRITCHSDCKSKVPFPCTPITTTPNSKRVDLNIADFAPKIPPYIPALILHCVMEVESRGLTETGLYRIPGSEREVKELKEKFFRGKGIPKLTKADIHAICGCIKEFLRTLNEPLVTHKLWKDFVSASETNDELMSLRKLKALVINLPPTNRDTLAYMIMHLQLISKSPDCKMPSTNLSRVFGPTLVGYSKADLEPALMIKETKQQAQVIEQLMKISQDFWASFINVVNIVTPTVFGTPETPEIETVHESILGPLTPTEPSITTRARTLLRHSTLGPRDGLKTRSYKRPQQFFASPMLQ